MNYNNIFVYSQANVVLQNNHALCTVYFMNFEFTDFSHRLIILVNTFNHVLKTPLLHNWGVICPVGYYR